MLRFALLLVCASPCLAGIGYEPGPMVKATRGKVWPQPQTQEDFTDLFVIRPAIFTFEVAGQTCDILQSALNRYQTLISTKHKLYNSRMSQGSTRASLDVLKVSLQTTCEQYPSLGMDEMYDLRINSPDLPGEGLLQSASVWGILRGLETFAQLIIPDDELGELVIRSTIIQDYPRFSHRGLLIDTSRHFLPLSAILNTLEAMEINKMNVLHWHIVDDQSFAYQSALYPELSEEGAYTRDRVYTREMIREVIEFGRLRGIRVMIEFDTPGHTRSWGLGIPNLLTPCYNGTELDGSFGPINPTLEDTYTFLQAFFQEASELFPESYIHLGGDEVNFACWKSNPDILAFMEAQNISGDFEALEDFYMQRLVNIIDEGQSKSIVWQEVFDNNVSLPIDTVIHVWKGNETQELARVTASGRTALLSSCWYLDHLDWGGDWQKFYKCDPHNFTGTQEQKDRVLGGEACMWGEVVDEMNLSTRLWPRASAAAEKLWSAEDVTNITEAAQRIEEHWCRLKSRGIRAQPPNGAGFCPN